MVSEQVTRESTDDNSKRATIKDYTVCVVGLGYVGLPLAESFANKIRTIGFEIVKEKADEISYNTKTPLIATSDPTMIKEADLIAICVPTPVLKSKEPDLSYVKSAAEIVGQNLKHNAIVVLESTVYPGVTEEVIVPILEKESGMKCGTDFKVGYSPERINPGDESHTLDKITKIVSGIDDSTTDTLAELYGLITKVYKAQNIKTAEAAKVIENIQRDLNIALMNELSLIFSRMDIDTRAVIEAASTKWNFHQYRPGLVGGHCIPVDPYYLVYKANELGYHPQVILAGRAINDNMPKHVAEMAIKRMIEAGKVIIDSKVLIMGFTYKENVPDIRESPVERMVKELKEFHVDIYGYDPLLATPDIEKFGAKAIEDLDTGMQVDCIVINSPHDVFKQLAIQDLLGICNEKPVIIDVTGIYKEYEKMLDGHYFRI